MPLALEKCFCDNVVGDGALLSSTSLATAALRIDTLFITQFHLRFFVRLVIQLYSVRICRVYFIFLCRSEVAISGCRVLLNRVNSELVLVLFDVTGQIFEVLYVFSLSLLISRHVHYLEHLLFTQLCRNLLRMLSRILLGQVLVHAMV